MWSIFEELLTARNLSVNDVAKATHIGNSTFTDWKKGKSTPKQDKMVKIANYFNVSLEYLTTGKDSKYSDEDAKLLAVIKNDKDLFETVQRLIAMPKDERNAFINLISLMEKKK